MYVFGVLHTEWDTYLRLTALRWLSPSVSRARADLDAASTVRNLER